MAENKITLGQLVNVLTESGIDLGTVYLSDNQIKSIEENLTGDQVRSLAKIGKNLLSQMSEDELEKAGGGKTFKEVAKKTIDIGSKVIAGVTIVGGAAAGILTTVLKLTPNEKLTGIREKVTGAGTWLATGRS